MLFVINTKISYQSIGSISIYFTQSIYTSERRLEQTQYQVNPRILKVAQDFAEYINKQVLSSNLETLEQKPLPTQKSRNRSQEHPNPIGKLARQIERSPGRSLLFHAVRRESYESSAGLGRKGIWIRTQLLRRVAAQFTECALLRN